MTGRHDRSEDAGSDEGDPPRTGPIVVTGLGRGVKDLFRSSGVDQRHRATPADTRDDDDAEGGVPAPVDRELSATGNSTRGPATSSSAGDSADASRDGSAAGVRRAPGRADESAGEGEQGSVREGGAEQPGAIADDKTGVHAIQSVQQAQLVVDGAGSSGSAPPATMETSQPTEQARAHPIITSPVTSVAAHPPTPRRRPRWTTDRVGVLVVVLLAVVCAGLIAAVVNRSQQDRATAAGAAAVYETRTPATAPPAASPTPSETSAADGPRVEVISDGTATRAASGVGASERWPSLLARRTGGSVESVASNGAGYVTSSDSGATFGAAAAKVPEDAQTVVFFGAAADAGAPSISIAKAATGAISTAARRAPEATVIVVGPVLRGTASSSDFAALRSALRGAARLAEVTWVDPIDSDWLPDGDADSGSALSAVEERTVAAKLQSVIATATD